MKIKILILMILVSTRVQSLELEEGRFDNKYNILELITKKYKEHGKNIYSLASTILDALCVIMDKDPEIQEADHPLDVYIKLQKNLSEKVVQLLEFKAIFGEPNDNTPKTVCNILAITTLLIELIKDEENLKALYALVERITEEFEKSKKIAAD